MSVRPEDEDGMPSQRPAGVFHRGAALYLDTIAISCFMVLLYKSASPWRSPFGFVGFLIVLPLASHIVYFLVLEGAFRLGTLGKRIMGLKVISEDGSSPTRGQFIARNLGRAVDILPISYLLGILLMTSDPRRRRFGDRVAHTIVVAPSSRNILLGPMLLVLLVGFLFPPLVFRTAIRPPLFPGRPFLEMEVLSQLPIVVERDGSFGVVLSIENVGRANASGCMMELMAPDYVEARSPEELIIGDLPVNQSITRTLAFKVSANARYDNFFMVLRVSSGGKGYATVTVAVTRGE